MREIRPRTVWEAGEVSRVANLVNLKCPRCGEAMDETCEPGNCKDPECPILYGEKK